MSNRERDKSIGFAARYGRWDTLGNVLPGGTGVKIFGQIEGYKAAWFHVLRKRNPPEVGERIIVTLDPPPIRAVRRECVVEEIEELPGSPFYRLRRVD